MTTDQELAFTSAVEQGQLIRRGEISPLELVQLYLDRIEKFNEQLGCYYTVAAEMALAEARTKTEQLTQLKNTTDLPLLFGVPISVKDLNPVAGLPCSYGTMALKERIANYDDGVVTRIKQGGLIILGKTATCELGSLPYTEPPGFPPTRNPWNLNYTPGGSSGGAASAVAAGLSPFAQGSDGGGSIRGPAFCCGLVGIKPSRGRVSNAPVGDYQSGISTHGPLARTVADAAALLDVMSGYITGDPYWLEPPEISFFAATRRQTPSMRIAYNLGNIAGMSVAPICAEQVKQTVEILEAMGHTLEPACPDFSSLVNPFSRIWQAGAAASGLPLEALSSFNQWLANQAGSAGDYLQAVHQMQVLAREIVAFFDDFDVLLLPTYLHPPIAIGEWADLSPPETLEKIIQWIAPCPPVNASGLPAIALPTGFDAQGLPVGIQLIGRPAGEITLISLATQLETARPWSGFRPSLFM
ncbi:amidase [Gloeocapsa sp. PCC 73106]|uniref:amidase n=1 Tax=Gloeocapsa sp. PCC 73106 TaxID=102232 RepID=UPI0002AC2838|nr:amidase [Gloeocapsa sp. PCC 73106]ELR96221.1 amidase, Asp-tRNAAsn/Glu-tRNAGln amidotransferase A subunit [Gloeocapsa sp. PCC 73106]